MTNPLTLTNAEIAHLQAVYSDGQMNSDATGDDEASEWAKHVDGLLSIVDAFDCTQAVADATICHYGA
jgi:hypothetical protein